MKGKLSEQVSNACSPRVPFKNLGALRHSRLIMKKEFPSEPKTITSESVQNPTAFYMSSIASQQCKSPPVVDQKINQFKRAYVPIPLVNQKRLFSANDRLNVTESLPSTAQTARIHKKINNFTSRN